MSDLESRAREGEEREDDAARALARLTDCNALRGAGLGRRELYGGDMEAASAVMRTVANRIQYMLQSRPGEFKFFSSFEFFLFFFMHASTSCSTYLSYIF